AAAHDGQARRDRLVGGLTMMADGGTASPDYRAAIDALAARTTHGVRLGLDRTRALLEACGAPHERLRALHVAGTNGKGSTCATLEAVLLQQGFRVGRYSSPHLIDFSERVLVDGAATSADQVLHWLDAHHDDIERLGATFFEATTAMAFDLFVQANVDIAVIEVGLGGRLDSTNVITPLVAAVTSIGLDHREYLGDTLELIALEKAGIFKRGVPAVIGDRDPAITAILQDAAERAGASRIVIATDDLPLQSVRVSARGTELVLGEGTGRISVTSALLGEHQAQNVATAIAVLRAAGAPWTPDRDALSAGVAATRLAGRFQRVGRWLFDVAHNPDGMTTVARSLATVRLPRPLGAVVCVLSDKDWRAMLDTLLPAIDHLWLTDAPTAPVSRRWPLDDVLAYARARAGDRCTVTAVPDLTDALRQAEANAATVLVTGSFHTVGDAMQRLEIDPLGG
ncbi:MAG TPA: folylpolyglutamate synthase/dihydrofolate synthase family protein, partial [Gemmatimonadaceae bacterium]|nr:folylpolyglutamate synthase/dihydrofolate synthase family protein [Gemmatimonadaceae bacterium]